ncbi:DUF2267 domain-containing protein [Candidatus Solirubrobacter pratensis]|uniref:DUF2267 domain-containing protein n=1 Tax=Candidatus Solirubrobacter pratensis TaxID=1298857 RepID=UPI000684FA85|nr:DUF2267 domain-containing protein [Candidatus Solirubrobacter pratensis]
MSEQYERFVTAVQQKASINREAAERAAQATLQTLAERLSQGQARDLAAQLPEPLAGWLFTDTDAAPFGLEEFLRRVAERLGVDVESAQRYAHAVFTALGRTVDPSEIADMTAELRQEFAPLVAEAENRFCSPVTLEALLDGVADRAGLFPDGARKATEAVLETLAERIAAGEVDDLTALLPLELHASLERGKQRGNGKAVRMSLDDFVRRVAEREGISLEAAREHVAAVLGTLRELLPDAEWRDVTAQLPHDYKALAT